MDTSKEYIEMCEKAKEIQENHKIISGDYFNGGEICEDIFECNNDEGYLIKTIYGKWFLPSECVWLPRQDQLQEMVNRSYHPFGLVFGLCGFVKKLPVKVTSMEQLWLAFVMYEKFNKIWDGKKWIKKND